MFRDGGRVENLNMQREFRMLFDRLRTFSDRPSTGPVDDDNREAAVGSPTTEGSGTVPRQRRVSSRYSEPKVLMTGAERV